jgi:hypothetical protein
MEDGMFQKRRNPVTRFNDYSNLHGAGAVIPQVIGTKKSKNVNIPRGSKVGLGSESRP